MHFTLKEVIAVVLFSCSLTATWLDLRGEVRQVKAEVRIMNGQVQWLLGEAIRSGWQPPAGWTFKEYPETHP